MLLAKWMGLVSFFAGAAGISGLFLKLYVAFTRCTFYLILYTQDI